MLILRAPLPDLSLRPSQWARRSAGLDGIVAQSEKRFSSPFSRKKIFGGCREDFAPKSASWACNAAIHDKEVFVVDPKKGYEGVERGPWTLSVSFRVRRGRRHSSAGANPARQLSLQPVAVGADDGGNDIV